MIKQPQKRIKESISVVRAKDADMEVRMKKLEEYVRCIPDFPEKGVMFRDVTSVLQDADGLHLARLSMGAPLPNVLILSGVAVALQEVLEAPVPGVLRADPPGHEWSRRSSVSGR